MANDEQKETLKKIFAMFDEAKTGFVATDKFVNILNTLGQTFNEEELNTKVQEIDIKKEGKVNFECFCNILSAFCEEEDDAEAMAEELREAFRLYDKEGNGYITTNTLKEIMKELDHKLTADDLEAIIEEVDEDGSGTVDFDEFMEMMTGE